MHDLVHRPPATQVGLLHSSHPEVARGVQERVADALGTMCDVTVTGVDVSIEELA